MPKKYKEIVGVVFVITFVVLTIFLAFIYFLGRTDKYCRYGLRLYRNGVTFNSESGYECHCVDGESVCTTSE
jgi:hypothetical protein